MAFNKKFLGLSALVVGAILFMAWLAGLLHFGKIAPGLIPLKGAPAPGQILVVQETAIPQELEVLGTVISQSLAQVSSQVPGRPDAPKFFGPKLGSLQVTLACPGRRYVLGDSKPGANGPLRSLGVALVMMACESTAFVTRPPINSA